MPGRSTRSLDFMRSEQRRSWELVPQLALVAFVSAAIVVTYYYFWELGIRFSPTGKPMSVPAAGRAYMFAVEMIYGAFSQVARFVVDLFPFRGHGIRFLSILTAVTLQNLALWYVAKWWFRNDKPA